MHAHDADEVEALDLHVADAFGGGDHVVERGRAELILAGHQALRRRHRADLALGGQFVQPVEREDDIPVLLEPGAV